MHFSNLTGRADTIAILSLGGKSGPKRADRIAAGLPKHRAGILVDGQFGTRILREASTNGFITTMPAEKSGEFGPQCAAHIAGRYLEWAKVSEGCKE